MRTLPLLAALVLVTCVRNPASPPPPQEYDKSIQFPKALDSGGVILGRPNQKLIMDGAVVQAMMIAAKDFIPPYASNDPCWTRPADFFYEVIRQENIIFVEISPNYSAEGCELVAAPLDWGALYAISTDGRILRRANPDELHWTSRPSSPDAGEDEDAGYSRLYELSDLDRMNTEPVDDPPFFTRPEWQAKNPWPPSRKPRPSLSPDGGTPDGGFHADGGSPAIPPG